MKGQPRIPASRRFSFLTVLLLLMLASCIKQDSFPVIPEITPRTFVLVFDTGQYAINGYLSFNFQDGDGDIGLAPRDTFPPYNRGGDYYYNLVIRYYEKQEGQWVEKVLDPPFSARIPVLNPDYPGKAIKGFIVDTLSLDPAPDFDTVRFEYFILDRALHPSNILTSPDLILKRQI